MLPLQSLIHRRQVFNPGQVMSELDASLLQMSGPGQEQVLSHRLIEVSSVCEEGGGKETVSRHGCHLEECIS